MDTQIKVAQANAPQELKNVANWLRNKSGIKVKTGALGGKRADYFKGKSAVKAVQSDAYKKLKNVPAVNSEEEAKAVLHSLIPNTFYLRVSKGASSGGLRQLQVVPQQAFLPEETYVWFIEPNQTRQILMAVGMVAVVLAGVMFPLWPVKMRIAVWYLSMAMLGFIGLFFAISLVRPVIWLVTMVVASPGIWLFPNLHADCGFVESFIPVWAWDEPAPPKKHKHKKHHKSKKASKESKNNGNGTIEGAKITEIQE